MKEVFLHFPPQICQKQELSPQNCPNSSSHGQYFNLTSQLLQNNPFQDKSEEELFEQISKSILSNPFNVVQFSGSTNQRILGYKKEDLEENNKKTKSSQKSEQILGQDEEQKQLSENNQIPKEIELGQVTKNKVDMEFQGQKKEIRKFQKQKSDYNCQILRATIKKLCLPVSEEGISSGPKNKKSKVHFFKFFKEVGQRINCNPSQARKFMECYEVMKQKKLLEIGKKFSPRFVDMIRCECNLMQKQICHMLETNDFDNIPQQSYQTENGIKTFHPKTKSAYQECLQGLKTMEKNEI